MDEKLLSVVIEGVKDARDVMLCDLGQLTHEDLDRTWMSGERRAYDFIYEVAIVNNRIAKRLAGEDPGPMPWVFGKEWLKAPDYYRDKARASEFLSDSSDAVRTAAETSLLEGAKIVDLLAFSVRHMSYHDGQLNFIQSLKGDMALHW
jgi:hypothetical protein